jgi:hypothetical protein
MMALKLAPIYIGQAKEWVNKHHSHLYAPIAGLFAVSVEDDGRRCCVGIASIPKARALMEQGCCEIVRVASDGTKHAASMTVAALSRAAIALGYRRIVSSTLLGESGVSYSAAGWWPVHIQKKVYSWGNHTKNPGAQTQTQPVRKVRWEFGPDALPKDKEILQQVKEAICENPGIERRPHPLPLFAELEKEKETPSEIELTVVR